MTALLGIHSLSKSFGTQFLFEDISFTINQRDRIGLIGTNGTGKSTLLKILVDLEKADSGNVTRRNGLRIAYASQSPEFPALPLEDLLVQSTKEGSEEQRRTRARILLSKMQFSDCMQNASSLSGGWRKRLDIARGLMQEPDLVVLDEPTNHLDLEGILWLEKFLNSEKFAFIVVSHDRYFLDNICTKIIELSYCYDEGIFISDGNMKTFVERKEQYLAGLAQQKQSLANVVRGEVDWLKRSPKARTTKSRSRVDKAYELLEELSDLKRRNKVSTVNLAFNASERETRKLLVAKNLCKNMGGRELFKGLDVSLSPYSRLGIVGKNGTGKTSLLKILAGTVAQDGGTIKYADDLKLVYFDQHREQIPPNVTLRDSLSPNGDYVNYHGQMIHVNGWAKRFLFHPDRLSLPVGCLSGGEQARILIAKLMLEPADVLFLDEPTNDLDIPTLEVIEESLKEFAGAVVLISHDRCLMDRLCNQILVLDESGHEYFADYPQWVNKQKSLVKKEKEAVIKPKQDFEKPKSKKLSYKEELELQNMEKAILEQEEKIQGLEERLTTCSPAESVELYQQLAEAQSGLEAIYDRWNYLVQLKSK